MTHVDIAIPTHGHSPWLAEVVESVLAQTHTDFTLTVSENGPGGGAAGRILEAYADDPRVRHVVTGGVPIDENWNRCFAIGSAPYVTVLPHDEQWDPEWLEARVRFLDGHPAAGFVFSGTREIRENGELIGLPRHPFSDGLHHQSAFVPLQYERNRVGCCSVLARRSAVETLDPPMVAHLQVGMDWMMWLRLGARFPVGYLARHDNAGRIHDGSVTATYTDLGAMHRHITVEADRIVAAEMPGFRIPSHIRLRRLVTISHMEALDALERGDLESARRCLREARALTPASVLTVRGAFARAALLGGPRGLQALRAAREAESTLRLRAQLSDIAARTAASITPWLPFL